MIPENPEAKMAARHLAGACDDRILTLYELALAVRDTARCTFNQAAMAVMAECEPRLPHGWRRRGTLSGMVAGYREDCAARGLGRDEIDELVLARYGQELEYLTVAGAGWGRP